MKATTSFEKAIEKHLKERGFTDPLFAKTLAKENKSLKECCNYILNTVKKSGENGFADEEIFAMAVHYYDEDSITAKSGPNGQVVVNHKIMLTDEEIADAKSKAKAEVISEEKARMRKKPEKAKVETPKEKTEPKTLF